MTESFLTKITIRPTIAGVWHAHVIEHHTGYTCSYYRYYDTLPKLRSTLEDSFKEHRTIIVYVLEVEDQEVILRDDSDWVIATLQYSPKVIG